MRFDLVLLIAFAVALSACQRSETKTDVLPPPVSAPSATAPQPARVTTIELGTQLTGEGRVAPETAKTTFAPTDTIYASVATDNASAATLSARWTFEDGQLVSENSTPVARSGQTAATEFHIAKPDGWPAGRYKVEIALNGQPAGSREFEVR